MLFFNIIKYIVRRKTRPLRKVHVKYPRTYIHSLEPTASEGPMDTKARHIGNLIELINSPNVSRQY